MLRVNTPFQLIQGPPNEADFLYSSAGKGFQLSQQLKLAAPTNISGPIVPVASAPSERALACVGKKRGLMLHREGKWTVAGWPAADQARLSLWTCEMSPSGDELVVMSSGSGGTELWLYQAIEGLFTKLASNVSPWFALSWPKREIIFPRQPPANAEKGPAGDSLVILDLDDPEARRYLPVTAGTLRFVSVDKGGRCWPGIRSISLQRVIAFQLERCIRFHSMTAPAQ